MPSKSDQALELRLQLAILDAKESCEKFIERHVKIKDPDVPGQIAPFLLWPKQREALQAFLEDRLVLVLKARQLGLTWLTLAYALWRMLFQPGYTVKALSKKEDPDAKELIRRMEFMLKYLPAWIARPAKGCDPRFMGPTWECTTLTITIHHRGSEDSTFQSLSAAPDSGRSMTGNLAMIDEWAFQEWAEEIWASIFPTVNRPTGGQVIGLSTMKIGSLFDALSTEAEAGRGVFREVFLDRWSDPRRDQVWFERTKLALPNAWRSEYPETPEEARSVGDEAFFLEWQEGVHVPVDHWEPPRSTAWPIIGVYDPAYNQACFKWYTISPGVPGFPKGYARCFREYAPVHITARDQAREILRLSCYRDGKESKIKDPYGGEDIELPGTPFLFRYIVGDTRAWVKGDDSGISTAEIFARYGLPMRQASKSLEQGWMELHEWLKPVPDLESPDGRMTAKLTFTKDCRMTRSTYPACVPSKTKPDDISDKTPHDPQDCDRYLVMSRLKAYDKQDTDLDRIEAKFGADSPEAVIFRHHSKDKGRKGGIGLSKLGF